MSHNSSAIALEQSLSSPARKSVRGFWASFYDAWLKAYGTRVDSNGNVICEL